MTAMMRSFLREGRQDNIIIKLLIYSSIAFSIVLLVFAVLNAVMNPWYVYILGGYSITSISWICFRLAITTTIIIISALFSKEIKKIVESDEKT